MCVFKRIDKMVSYAIQYVTVYAPNGRAYTYSHKFIASSFRLSLSWRRYLCVCNKTLCISDGGMDGVNAGTGRTNIKPNLD